MVFPDELHADAPVTMAAVREMRSAATPFPDVPSSSLEAARAGWAPGTRDADGLARQLAAYTTTGQFTQGLHYLLEGISSHTANNPAQ